MKLNFWWARDTIYRSRNIMLYTWKLYSVINQCYLNKTSDMCGSHSVMSYSLQIFQARILEWVAVPFSRGSSQPRNRTQIFHTARWILYHLSHHGFPGGISGKESACQCRRHKSAGSIPGSGRSPGVGNSYPLQYSDLENSMGRGACWATVHKAAKSWTWLSTSIKNIKIKLYKLMIN